MSWSIYITAKKQEALEQLAQSSIYEGSPQFEKDAYERVKELLRFGIESQQAEFNAYEGQPVAYDKLFKIEAWGSAYNDGSQQNFGAKLDVVAQERPAS